jgi:hypothetical protein
MELMQLSASIDVTMERERATVCGSEGVHTEPDGVDWQRTNDFGETDSGLCATE